MEIKFVKPTAGNYDEDIASYITEGKVYPVQEIIDKVRNVFLVTIKDDDGDLIETMVNRLSSHLYMKGMFIPCDENGKEIR